VKNVRKKFNFTAYLVVASSDVSSPKKVRSKKGVLHNTKELQKLDHCNLEYDVNDGKTRLVSLVNLNDFEFNNSEGLILDWMHSFILISEAHIDKIVELIPNWINLDQKNNILPFNYDYIYRDIIDFKDAVLMRYFPADNGRDEIIAVVSNKKALLKLKQ
jgi:hypothetical protein